MIIVEEKDEYELSGKTGWSVDNGINNGWFVGYKITYSALALKIIN